MASDQSTESLKHLVDIIENGDSDATIVAPSILPDPTRHSSPTLAELKPPIVANSAGNPRAWGYDVEMINRDYVLVLYGNKAVVIKEQRDGPIRDRIRFISIDAFDHLFENRFTEVIGADGRPKVLPWGRAWRQDPRRRQCNGIEFFPNPDGAKSRTDYFNLWQGFGVEPSSNGSWSIFRDHLSVNVCNGDQQLFDWVVGWFAHIFQKPRERIGTALVLRGAMGSGKSKVGEVIGSLVPAHYFQVDDPRYIVGQFNAHMGSCLFLQAEEAVWAGDKHAEGRLKGLITSEHQMIESKGVDSICMPNRIRLMMTSNEAWVVPAGMEERRFCVIDVNPRCAQNHDYFAEMQAQLDQGGSKRLLYDLLNFDLSKVNLRKIPRTAALLEQKLRSLDPLHDWWFNRLTEGTPTRDAKAWQKLVTVDALYADYLKAGDEVGIGRRNSRPTFGRTLLKMVPGIHKTRPGRGDDGNRPWSYEMPSLADCRDAFEAMAGQPVTWPAIEANGNDVGYPADDEVPA